jgi:phosphoribosyl-ATP pyrophosphohydrolase
MDGAYGHAGAGENKLLTVEVKDLFYHVFATFFAFNVTIKRFYRLII